MVQVAEPPETNVPQLLVWWKSPLAVMLLMLSVALPGLVRVTIMGVVLVLSGSFPKLISWG